VREDGWDISEFIGKEILEVLLTSAVGSIGKAEDRGLVSLKKRDRWTIP
jgi:hypothetical protein